MTNNEEVTIGLLACKFWKKIRDLLVGAGRDGGTDNSVMGGGF